VFVQIAKGNRPELVVFLVNLDMDAMGFAASAQTDNFGKRRCLVNLFLDVGARARRSGGSAGSSRSGSPRKVGSYQRAGYFGTTTGTGGRFLGENRVN
jgi:hypothetical protein